VVIYVLQLATEAFVGVDVPGALGLKVNNLIELGQVWRLITPVFLHSSVFPSGLLHIGFNMYALYYLGATLERFYGRTRFLLLFLLGGFAGNVMSFIFSTYPSLGASTAIFGLLAAEGVLVYHNREIFGNSAQRALTQVVMIAVINLFIGLTPGARIDNWGHIGGLIGGLLFAWFGGPLFQKQGVFPPYVLANTRTKREVLRASIGVGALFAFLTIAVIYIRVG
jgi:rhomboid protease GluP